MYKEPLLKRYLPKTLFGRALLILFAPALLVQLVLIYQFYERHWDSVVRHLSASLAGEVELLYREYMNQPSLTQVQAKAEILGITVTRETGNQVIESGKGSEEHPEFYRQLQDRLQLPFMVEQRGREEDLMISLLVDDGVLRMQTTKKRLVSSTTYIFLMWTMGSSLLLLAIATLFLRNQIRPIRLLANAAERFGMGQTVTGFRPRGASEVRQAGRAFLIMRNRILRQVNTRTEMLAGISHDLRTPLTRMKLQLSMLPLEPGHRQELAREITEMEHMIDEYLQFAHGQNQEQAEPVELDKLVSEVVEPYIRQNQPVELDAKSEAIIEIRPRTMCRAIQNIIDNALRYGGEAKVRTFIDGAYRVIAVRDKGPGIPDEDKEDAFRPFTRLDPARNQDTSGAGLGLSICRDIVQAHGGTVELRNLKKGMEVLINLPCSQQQQQS